jgi:hypothetical protein
MSAHELQVLSTGSTWPTRVAPSLGSLRRLGSAAGIPRKFDTPPSPFSPRPVFGWRRCPTSWATLQAQR